MSFWIHFVRLKYARKRIVEVNEKTNRDPNIIVNALKKVYFFFLKNPEIMSSIANKTPHTSQRFSVSLNRVLSTYITFSIKSITIFFLILTVVSSVEAKVCQGKFVNPITDICWSCIFSITVAGITQVPAKITQESNKLKIEEVKI